MNHTVEIRPFEPSDREPVIRLWRGCDLVVPWNDPHADIDSKLRVQPELFLVGVRGGEVVATAMAGYEGHRGWVNYLAVTPDLRRNGLGRLLMDEVEARLRAVGCPKLNLQVRATNEEVVAFYRRLGYAIDPVVSLGKRLDDR